MRVAFCSHRTANYLARIIDGGSSCLNTAKSAQIDHPAAGVQEDVKRGTSYHALSGHFPGTIDPISNRAGREEGHRVDVHHAAVAVHKRVKAVARIDRKSTRLNSSHLVISYAVFC